MRAFFVRAGVIAMALTGVLFLIGITTAVAEFPERPITIIVSGGAGGGADIGARTLQPYLESYYGRTVVIVNRPGAGGALAFAEIAKAKPDGYTIGYLNLPNMAVQSIASKTPWTIDSFEYIANIVASRVTLNVLQSSPFKSLKELVDFAKAHPRVLTLGMSSLGGDDHLTQLQFMKAAGIEMTVVPFGDGASSRTALLGGHVSAASMSGSETASYQKELRALAIASDKRAPYLSGVPTMSELGYNVIGGSNQLLGAPKGVSVDILAKHRACYKAATNDPKFLADAAKRSIPVFFMDGETTEKFVREQHAIFKAMWDVSPWIK